MTKKELQELKNDPKYNLGLSEDFFYKHDWFFLKRQINQQRLANKLIKEIYEEAGVLSFHNIEMALANLARIESYKYTGKTKRTWFKRYLKIRYKGLIRPYRILAGRKKNE